MKRKIIVLMIVCLLLAMGNFQVLSAKEKLKIGALFPFTGDLARLGIDSFQGAELARIVQNERGGLLGKEIVFAKGDAVDPRKAMTEAERLIMKEGVDVILGTYSSSRSYAASEVAERYGKIYWELGAVSPKITSRGFKYLFRTCPMSTAYAKWAVKVAIEAACPQIGIRKEKLRVAVIFEDSLYGTTTGELVIEECKKRGLSVVATEPYSAKAVDLSSVIMRLKNAKPDVIIATQYLTDAILFWRQSKELNFYVKAFIGTGGGTSMYDFVRAVGRDANGLIDTSFCPPPDAVNPKYAPGVNEFIERYKKVFGHEVTSVYPPINYMGTMVLWDVIKKAGSTDPEAIREAAFEVDIPDNTTVTGFGVKFDSTGQNIRARVISEQWQDEKLWTVWPPEAALPGREIKLPIPTWEEKEK